MKKLTVTLVQANSKDGDIKANLTSVVKYMREAKEIGADIVLFPECFLTGYYAPGICLGLPPVGEIENHPDFLRYCAEALTEEDESFKTVRDLAAGLGLGVLITGFSRGRRHPRDTAWLIDRDGEVILKYSKVHTCDFDWERYLEPGDSFPVCSFDGVKIGAMICYDREYPESARELMLGGSELILLPNCCSDMEPRLRELSVRAMENMVGICMANPPGENMGRSCAYSPVVWDNEGGSNLLFAAGEKEEGIFPVTLDIEEFRGYREREDLGKFLKPSAYKNLREMLSR